MKKSAIIASKGDVPKEPVVEEQSLLGNVFQKVINMINGEREEEDDTSDVEAPAIIGRGLFAS